MKKVQGILLLLVYICLATALLSEAFVGSYNLQNLLRRTSLFGIISVGVAFVIITGGIDLSIGSVIGLVGCLLPMLLVDFGFDIGTTLCLVVLLSLLLGLVHGLLITKVGLQPFVVTLCGLLIYRGLARWITGDQTKGFGTEYDDSLRLLATGKVCSVPLAMMILGALLSLWQVFRLFRRKHGGDDSQPSGMLIFGLFSGITLAVIGSSPIWYSPESAGGFLSVTSSRDVPAALMQSLGWLCVPALLWFLVLNFRSDWKSILGPLLVAALAATLVRGAMWITWQEDSWFWPNEAWTEFWKRTCVFVSLGMLMGALAWFGRAGLRNAGSAGRVPLAIASAAAAMGLLGHTSLGQTMVPAPFLIMLGIALVAAVFLNRTIYGRYLLALGRNQEAARYSGINTDRMVILAYVICSGAAGIGGILIALDGNSVQPSGHGSFYELYAIAAAVLGGCSLRGGEGSILGVVIGAAVMRVLYNSINLLGIPTQLEFAIIGLVILIGVTVDELVKRFAARKRLEMSQS